MTSNPEITEYSFRIVASDLVAGALNRPGTVRVDKLYTLSQSIVVKVFGRVGLDVLERIRRALDSLTASSS